MDDEEKFRPTENGGRGNDRREDLENRPENRTTDQLEGANRCLDVAERINRRGRELMNHEVDHNRLTEYLNHCLGGLFSNGSGTPAAQTDNQWPSASSDTCGSDLIIDHETRFINGLIREVFYKEIVCVFCKKKESVRSNDGRTKYCFDCKQNLRDKEPPSSYWTTPVAGGTSACLDCPNPLPVFKSKRACYEKYRLNRDLVKRNSSFTGTKIKREFEDSDAEEPQPGPSNWVPPQQESNRVGIDDPDIGNWQELKPHNPGSNPSATAQIGTTGVRLAQRDALLTSTPRRSLSLSPESNQDRRRSNGDKIGVCEDCSKSCKLYARNKCRSCYLSEREVCFICGKLKHLLPNRRCRACADAMAPEQSPVNNGRVAGERPQLSDAIVPERQAARGAAERITAAMNEIHFGSPQKRLSTERPACVTPSKIRTPNAHWQTVVGNVSRSIHPIAARNAEQTNRAEAAPQPQNFTPNPLTPSRFDPKSNAAMPPAGGVANRRHTDQEVRSPAGPISRSTSNPPNYSSSGKEYNYQIRSPMNLSNNSTNRSQQASEDGNASGCSNKTEVSNSRLDRQYASFRRPAAVPAIWRTSSSGAERSSLFSEQQMPSNSERGSVKSANTTANTSSAMGQPGLSYPNSAGNSVNEPRETFPNFSSHNKSSANIDEQPNSSHATANLSETHSSGATSTGPRRQSDLITFRNGNENSQPQQREQSNAEPRSRHNSNDPSRVLQPHDTQGVPTARLAPGRSDPRLKNDENNTTVSVSGKSSATSSSSAPTAAAAAKEKERNDALKQKERNANKEKNAHRNEKERSEKSTQPKPFDRAAKQREKSRDPRLPKETKTERSQNPSASTLSASATNPAAEKPPKTKPMPQEKPQDPRTREAPKDLRARRTATSLVTGGKRAALSSTSEKRATSPSSVEKRTREKLPEKKSHSADKPTGSTDRPQKPVPPVEKPQKPTSSTGSLQKSNPTPEKPANSADKPTQPPAVNWPEKVQTAATQPPNNVPKSAPAAETPTKSSLWERANAELARLAANGPKNPAPVTTSLNVKTVSMETPAGQRTILRAKGIEAPRLVPIVGLAEKRQRLASLSPMTSPSMTPPSDTSEGNLFVNVAPLSRTPLKLPNANVEPLFRPPPPPPEMYLCPPPPPPPPQLEAEQPPLPPPQLEAEQPPPPPPQLEAEQPPPPPQLEAEHPPPPPPPPPAPEPPTKKPRTAENANAGVLTPSTQPNARQSSHRPSHSHSNGPPVAPPLYPPKSPSRYWSNVPTFSPPILQREETENGFWTNDARSSSAMPNAPANSHEFRESVGKCVQCNLPGIPQNRHGICRCCFTQSKN